MGKHLEYEKLGAEPYIVRTVREGYRLEFDFVPPVSFLPNNRSAREAPDFVKSELERSPGRVKRIPVGPEKGM